MPRKSVAQLREEIIADTLELAQLIEQRDDLRRAHAEAAKRVRTVAARRERHLISARAAGAAVADLAADTGLTPGRIRQVAPLPKGAKPARAAARPRAAATVSLPAYTLHCAGCGTDHAPEDCEQRPAAPAAAVPEQAPQHDHDQDQEHVQEHEHTARPTRPRPAGGKLGAPRGAYSIAGRVEQALSEHGGDIEAATAALIASAIPDAMALLDASRSGARYDYTAHPSLPDPLKRPGRKQADQIWEGRPRYVHASTPAGTLVHVLDMNGAYLSALRRTHLPIGRLVEDAPGTPFDRRRAGIYLIEPPQWQDPSMPNPLGDGREQEGPVWVTDATVRLLIRAAADSTASGTRTAGPRILQSYTSGASENLLAKFGDELAAARRRALAEDDPVTLEYVKAMYSKFVSTAGDSRANHDIFRPEWVHAIRSQAYANLWYKAQKARGAGLLVHRMSGTDELHVAGPWREATTITGAPPNVRTRPLFPEGRDLAEVKCKRTYTVGGGADHA